MRAAASTQPFEVFRNEQLFFHRLGQRFQSFGQIACAPDGCHVDSIIALVIAAILSLGLGFVVLLADSRDAVSIESALALIATGLLCLAAIPLGRIKLIECYENGVIVRKLFKSRTVLHKDVAAVQFLAVMNYKHGIYVGTISHFTIIPMVDKTINIRIHGFRKDSDRIWAIAQTILKRNPDARLEKIL